MKRLALILLGLLILGAALYAFLGRSLSSAGSAPELAGAPAAADELARGQYLIEAADCEACHTLEGTGKSFAGGVPFRLPFGVIYSSNITSEPATGIGAWSDEEFVRAVREGVGRQGEHLYPAHPYTSYTQLSRADALAMKRFLFTLPAVLQPARANTLGFPFNQRWLIGFWKAAFFSSHRFTADPAKSAQWNRGAYLATALGHCAECHTPRNFAFGLAQGRALAGEAILGWRAYNITSDPAYGIGSWSDADLLSYLRSGHADWRGSASGPMGEAIEHSLRHLAPQDSEALLAYLRSVPPQKGARPIEVDSRPPAASASTAIAPGAARGGAPGAGEQMFAGACASCHAWNGAGLQSPYAALLGTRGVNDVSGLNVTQVILKGAKFDFGAGEVMMPAFAASYSNAEVAALANYVIAHFGNKQGEVTALDVAKLR